MSTNSQLGMLPPLSFAMYRGDKSPLVLVHAQGTDSHSFDCGHGIHIEKPKEFTRSVIDVSCLDL